MTQDFASKKRAAPRQQKKGPRSGGRPAARGKQDSSPWTWFSAGLLCGVFLSALAWLALQQPDRAAMEAAVRNVAPGAGEKEERRPRFDFYTLLPEQSVEVDMDDAGVEAARQSPDKDEFLLQAGSFKLPEDADRRRAELLLLGLDAHVEEADGDNGRWYRVYIGPFESRSRLARARSLTAQQGIDTLLLKRPQPNQG